MNNIINLIESLNKEKTIDLIIAVVIVAILDILSPLFSFLIIKVFNFKMKNKEVKNSAFYTPLRLFFRITGIYLAMLFLKPTFIPFI